MNESRYLGGGPSFLVTLTALDFGRLAHLPVAWRDVAWPDAARPPSSRKEDQKGPRAPDAHGDVPGHVGPSEASVQTPLHTPTSGLSWAWIQVPDLKDRESGHWQLTCRNSGTGPRPDSNRGACKGPHAQWSTETTTLINWP
jgi:hypothetical protein